MSRPRVVRYFDNGFRTGIHLGTGRKFHKLLTLSDGFPCVRTTRLRKDCVLVPVIKNGKPYPVDRAMDAMRRIAHEVGLDNLSQDASSALGV